MSARVISSASRYAKDAKMNISPKQEVHCTWMACRSRGLNLMNNCYDYLVAGRRTKFKILINLIL